MFARSSYSSKSVLVLGLGSSGVSAAKFLLQNGAKVYAYDDNLLKGKDIDGIGAFPEKNFERVENPKSLDFKRIDFVLVSPGIPPTHILYRKAKDRSVQIIGEAEFALRCISQKKIGITGTNGKTTVTMMTAHVLNDIGMAAQAVGNIGVPLTSLLSSRISSDVFVVELSSFQLETMSSSVFDFAIILNIFPDHLDRYSSFEEYAKAKLRIQNCLKEGGKLFVEDNVSARWHKFLSFPTLSFEKASKETIESILPFRYKKRAEYELKNLLSAYVLCSELGVSSEQFRKAMETFKKPAHRVEFVRKVNGVSYYNDSKATNVDAVVKAVDSLPGDIILIAGGKDKGLSYRLWLEAFKRKVKFICLLGEVAQRMARELSEGVKVMIFYRLYDAVVFAESMAKAGDNVLLSPGCTSFDMFENYAQRGEEFKRIVHQL